MYCQTSCLNIGAYTEHCNQCCFSPVITNHRVSLDGRQTHRVLWIGLKRFIHTYIQCTYTQIYIAPKSWKTNRRRCSWALALRIIIILYTWHL